VDRFVSLQRVSDTSNESMINGLWDSKGFQPCCYMEMVRNNQGIFRLRRNVREGREETKKRGKGGKRRERLRTISISKPAIFMRKIANKAAKADSTGRCCNQRRALGKYEPLDGLSGKLNRERYFHTIRKIEATEEIRAGEGRGLRG